MIPQIPGIPGDKDVLLVFGIILIIKGSYGIIKYVIAKRRRKNETE